MQGCGRGRLELAIAAGILGRTSLLVPSSRDVKGLQTRGVCAGCFECKIGLPGLVIGDLFQRSLVEVQKQVREEASD